MIKVFKPLGDGAFRREIVADATPYLADGWYLSPSDHQEAAPKKKAAPKKSTAAKAAPKKRTTSKKAEA